MNRRVLISLSLLAFTAILVTAGYLWYDQTHLRLVSVTPSPGNTKVTLIDPISFSYNKPLDPALVSSFTLSPYVDGVLTVAGSKLTFTPKGTYTIGVTYTATIKSPRAADGIETTDSTTHFTVNFVPFNEQTKAQQQANISDNDKLANTNPLLGSLPYENEDFKLDFTIASDGTVSYRLTLYAIINGPSDAATYQAQLKQFKQEAFSYIQGKGQDPTKLHITYNPTQAAGL